MCEILWFHGGDSDALVCSHVTRVVWYIRTDILKISATPKFSHTLNKKSVVYCETSARIYTLSDDTAKHTGIYFF
jgi:hypothetical protein